MGVQPLADQDFSVDRDRRDAVTRTRSEFEPSSPALMGKRLFGGTC